MSAAGNRLISLDALEARTSHEPSAQPTHVAEGVLAASIPSGTTEGSVVVIVNPSGVYAPEHSETTSPEETSERTSRGTPEREGTFISIERGQEIAFNDMQDLRPFAPIREEKASRLSRKIESNQGQLVSSVTATYRAEDQPHHQKTEATLVRYPGSYEVMLVTRTIQNVGGDVWKPVSNTVIVARTVNGKVAFGEESPEFYAKALTPDEQAKALNNLFATLREIRKAKREADEKAAQGERGRKSLHRGQKAIEGATPNTAGDDQ